MTPMELMDLAIEAREHAYVPYSGFSVGAALLTKDGKVYQGCNIENASYTPTNCAERTAFFKAVYDGEREFKAIAVVGGRADRPLGTEKNASGTVSAHCGVCRQVIREFCDDDFEIYLRKPNGELMTVTLAEILPLGFTQKDMA